MENQSTIIHILFTDELSVQAIEAFESKWNVMVRDRRGTMKHGFSLFLVECVGEPPEALFDELDRAMNVLDYTILYVDQPGEG